MKLKSIHLTTLMTLFVIITNVQLTNSQRIMDKLDRGLIAVRTSENETFISWRILAGDDNNTTFNIYRDGIKINTNPISGISNYTDTLVGNAQTYKVTVLKKGKETFESDESQILASAWFDISLKVPDALLMPNGSTCTYSPNDCSTGDLDGDGELEIIVKWDPNNSKDNSRRGYSGNVYLDAYKLNGKQLWRIDLGKNIRAGAHYTQFLVADFDGNGRSEVVCKTAPGTTDGHGNFLGKGPAKTADHTIDYRNEGGYILSGPEFITVFSGEKGEELSTDNYIPARGNVADWGDEYGNRVDRFLGGIAWLDGILPSIVMCRGYYTRAVVAAWDFRDGVLTNRWTYDSGTAPGVGLHNQGNHNLSVGDVDQDGKDEIIWGAGALDDNGKLMYRTGLGHGDAMHLSDLDPDRRGYELWTVHENKNARYGQELHDAKTGEIIWGTTTGTDNGRGLAANISSQHRGFEMWSSSVPGIANSKGNKVFDNKPSTNFRIYWDGDLEDELLNGNTISKFNAGNLLIATGCSSNNSTKSTPNLSADLFGDWREELVLRTSDNTKLRIFTTTIPTSTGMYTLMQDDIYRNGIAWQNTAYNQPPHVGFYVGSDMDGVPPSSVYLQELRWNNGSEWNLTSIGWKDSLNQDVGFKNHQKVLFDLNTKNTSQINISENIFPESVKINSPANISLFGIGQLLGDMNLQKTGSGMLELNNNNNAFSGETSVWNGKFMNNGNLLNSDVSVYNFATVGGSGTFKQIQLFSNANFQIGKNDDEISVLAITGDLIDHGGASYTFDMQVSGRSKAENDYLKIQGRWIIQGKSILNLQATGKNITKGNYVIGKCEDIIGNTNLEINGLPKNLHAQLIQKDGNIILSVRKK